MVLASSSPRRRDLLADAGLDFEVQDPAVEEPAHLSAGLSPAAYAESLAYFKARSVAESRPGDRVLGADTVVALDGRILGKPDDADDARRMLRDLSRNRHAVVTGLALIGPGEKRTLAADTTWVTMRPMTDEEIGDYIASGEWQGKAGAYAIQESADRFVTGLDGSFSNVVGLPMELLRQLLAEPDPTEPQPEPA